MPVGERSRSTTKPDAEPSTPSTQSSPFDVQRTSVGKSSTSSVPSAIPPAPATKIDIADITQSDTPPVRKKTICVPVAIGERDRGDRPPAADLGQPPADQHADEAGDAGRDRAEQRDAGVREVADVGEVLVRELRRRRR